MDISDIDSRDSSEDENFLHINSTSYIQAITQAKPKGKERTLEEAVRCEDSRCAIQSGRLDTVKEIYETNDVDIDNLLRYDWTGLMTAAYHGEEAIVSYFLEHGADVDRVDERSSKTPLILLCSKYVKTQGDYEACAKHLIEHGANIDALDKYHMNSLMFAAKTGHIGLVRLLIQNNAELNTQDYNGMTAVAFAAIKGHADIVYDLIKAKADFRLLTIDDLNITNLCYSQKQFQIGNMLNEIMRDETNVDSLLTVKKREHESSLKEGHDLKVETFLSELDLSGLNPLFAQNNIEFKNLLCITDEELQNIGVTKLGDRTEILKGLTVLHKAPFENSAYGVIRYNQNITNGDLMMSFLNLWDQIQYMNSTIVFINRMIQNDLKVKQDLEDLKLPVRICYDRAQQTKRNMSHLKACFEKICNNQEYLVADLIRPYKEDRKGMLEKLVWTGAFVCVGFVVRSFFKRKRQ